MSIDDNRVQKRIQKYEKHFNSPFPERTMLFSVGDPSNIDNLEEIFQEDINEVEEAIEKNRPIEEIPKEIWEGIQF